MWTEGHLRPCQDRSKKTTRDERHKLPQNAALCVSQGEGRDPDPCKRGRVEADQETVEARWQVAAVSPTRGYYVVARPLTAAEAQDFVDGLPFPSFVEPYSSGDHDRMPAADRASHIPGSSRHPL